MADAISSIVVVSGAIVSTLMCRLYVIPEYVSA
nr:MAG TPA: hypothetical protein [Caudoviricetes sp.]